MLLKKIHCLYFKNYTAIELNFSDQLNFFVGNNGSGKTNLLDAMHYLSLTKSAFNLADTQNIQHGADFFSVTGHFFKDKTNHDLQCIVKKNQKKIFKINQQPYDKLSDHIGLFPMVLLTPNDKDLIRGGGEARRSFFDSVLCQLDSHYLHTLMQYNHLLKQRNRLLKLHASGAPLDEDLLHTYSQQLLPLGRMIFEARKKFMQTFYTSFQHYHAWVTAADEAVACDYQSALAEPDFEQRFFKSISQDLALQRTTMGIHLDDFVFTLQGYLLKKNFENFFLIFFNNTLQVMVGFIFEKMTSYRKKICAMLNILRVCQIKSTFGQRQVMHGI